MTYSRNIITESLILITEFIAVLARGVWIAGVSRPRPTAGLGPRVGLATTLPPGGASCHWVVPAARSCGDPTGCVSLSGPLTRPSATLAPLCGARGLLE